ncbi:MAG: VTT domain-containing protein [Candidatus Aenigmarchaeota archaeon]|nr:VTT domain-containing protein [Candidatus Aenigmarchaeota archaeon]
MIEGFLNSFIRSYGSLGLLVVMIIQTIIAPISSEVLLMFSGALGMRVLDIVIFGSLGMIIGSVIAFYIARVGGKPIITKLVRKKWIDALDGWIERNGMWAILLTRLIPVMPFDLISYTSGITGLKFKNYFLATVIGAFPRTFLLAIVGGTAKAMLSSVGIGIELIFYVGIFGLLVLAYLDKKRHLDFIEDRVIGRIVKKKSKH